MHSNYVLFFHIFSTIVIILKYSCYYIPQYIIVFTVLFQNGLHYYAPYICVYRQQHRLRLKQLDIIVYCIHIFSHHNKIHYIILCYYIRLIDELIGYFSQYLRFDAVESTIILIRNGYQLLP